MLRSWKAFGLAFVATLGALLALSVPGPTGVKVALADHDEQLTIEVETPSGDFDFTVNTVSGTACTGSLADLGDEESGVLNCGDDSNVEIDWVPVAGYSISGDIACTITDDGDTAGNQSTIIDPDGSDGDVQVNIRDDEHVHCLYTFVTVGTPTSTPTATGTPATATPTATGTVTVSTLTVSIAPSTLSCNGSAFVTVVARNAAGQVVAAGTVTLSTTLGTISPTSAIDQGAGVLAVLTAPGTQGGTATITASAGGVTGSATATINCAQATATNTAIPPTAVPPTGITPPATGDGGLEAGSGWQRLAGFTLLGMALAGAAALGWRRARA